MQVYDKEKSEFIWVHSCRTMQTGGHLWEVMEKYIYSEYIALPHLPLDIGENIAIPLIMNISVCL